MNDKLFPCPACGQKVSKEAVNCPQCGHSFKYAGGIDLKDPVHMVGVAIAFLMVVGIVYTLLVTLGG